jgi:Molecular chaperone (small heat shock protein)
MGNNAMIDNLAESIGDAVSGVVDRTLGGTDTTQTLRSDCLESDDAYLVVFDAPGAEPDDVQVTYEDRTVTVRLERFRPLRESFEMQLPGRGLSLTGQTTLPDGPTVTPTAGAATLTDSGTLVVQIPKHENTTQSGNPTPATDG